MVPLAQRVIDKRLTYLTLEKLSFLMNTIERLNIDGVPGHIAEFGVALGGSAICIASKLGADRAFYGFDNFDLIPSPEPIDGARPNRRYEIIKSGASVGINGDPYYGYEKQRLPLVVRTFSDFDMPVDGKRITLIEGLFEKTLPRFLTMPIAFAHIDCDWYSPVSLCLDAVCPLLPIGGTLVVDDYDHWDGCTLATNEFCAKHPNISLTTRADKYAVLVKNADVSVS